MALNLKGNGAVATGGKHSVGPVAPATNFRGHTVGQCLRRGASSSGVCLDFYLRVKDFGNNDGESR
jgi:hypothetical protein